MGCADDYSTVHRHPTDHLRAPTSRRRSIVLTLASCAVLVLASGCSGGSGESGEERRDTVPDIELLSLTDGEPTEVSAITGAGTPTVINVWASWCVPCITEMPAFEEVSRERAGQVAIIGVTDDRDVDGARDLAERTGVTYALYRDEQRTLLPALKVTGLPATLFVDGDGVIVERHSGALDADGLRARIDRLWGAG